MILNEKDPMIECFADADFAGSWDKQDPEDPENVKSRTGFIVRFAGHPIQWGSKIQELISLSVVRSEHVTSSRWMDGRNNGTPEVQGSLC